MTRTNKKVSTNIFQNFNVVATPSVRGDNERNTPGTPNRKMAKKPTSKKPSAGKKSAPKQSAQKSSYGDLNPALSPVQSIKAQQRLLDIFSDAFSNVLTSDQFPVLLQEIKQALFNRDFAAAFGREDYLEAYAARWSPTRTLGYAAVLLGIRKHLGRIPVSSDTPRVESSETTDPARENPNPVEASSAVDESINDSSSNDLPSMEKLEISTKQSKESPATRSKPRKLRIISIGGCAAEHLAFASYVDETNTCGNLTLIDSGPWSSITNLLQTKITTPPPLSEYASEAIKASNEAFLEQHRLDLTFHQQDILSLDLLQLSELVKGGPLLITMLFTLNELYTSAGIAKTSKFLRNLGQVLADGSLVLVVDSPGSYSEAAVGKEKKKYPMQWLLDHTLIEVEAVGYRWEKLESEDSVWFRVPEELSYPIPLENMRYQLHLYRLEKST